MCYDCERREAERLAQPFRMMIPCVDEANPDDVLRPGALESYLGDLLRDHMEREVQRAEAAQPRPRTRSTRFQEAARSHRERVQALLERYGYSAAVDEAGGVWTRSGLFEGTRPEGTYVDETHEMTTERLQEWINRLGLDQDARGVDQPDTRETITFVRRLRDPQAPTAEELAAGEALQARIQPFSEGFRMGGVVHSGGGGYPRQEINWESSTAPGSNWRAAMDDLEDEGPSESSGMPFSWASRFERHPGWNAKARTLTVHATPYGQGTFTYRREELEEDVRWL